MKSPFKIAVVGLWHLGEIYSAGLAELGHTVIGLDTNKTTVKNFQKNIPALAEPHLDVMLASNKNAGRLSFTDDFKQVKDCNVLWLTLDTPVTSTDKARVQVVYSAINKALPHLKSGALIVISSQMPVGTSAKLMEVIRKKYPQRSFGYVYTPENLQLGEAVRCFMEPGRIVVGADGDASFAKMQKIFQKLNTTLLRMSPTSAEMVKHALNSFLATSLSFTYDLADLCEKVGVDILDVSKALRSDPRIGHKAYIDANIGFSGGTLGRDLQFLLASAKAHGIKMPVIASVFKKNSERKAIVYTRLAESLGSLKNKTIGILGLTYKAGTSTLRRSLALDLMKDLKSMGANLQLHDPMVKRSGFFDNVYDAVKGCHAVLVVTPWAELRTADLKRMKSAMKEPAVLFDTRNFFAGQETELKKFGFNYLGVGRPSA